MKRTMMIAVLLATASCGQRMDKDQADGDKPKASVSEPAGLKPPKAAKLTDAISCLRERRIAASQPPLTLAQLAKDAEPLSRDPRRMEDCRIEAQRRMAYDRDRLQGSKKKGPPAR